jgi:hypothetical protein
MPDARSQSTAQTLEGTAYRKLPELEDKGFVILKPFAEWVDPAEWESLEYIDWKSGGDTNFAPIATATGDMSVKGFWDFGKPDKGGLWNANAAKCPTLVKWVEAVGADFGRVRVIKLNPNTYEQVSSRFLHQDDNNRLNPPGTGWVVRSWLQLTDNPDSYMVVRERQDDPASESHIPLPAMSQFVVDTERLWHAVYHPGPEPRYALITSFESSDPVQRWINANRA